MSARALVVQPVLCRVVYSLPMTHPQQPIEASAQAGPRLGEVRQTWSEKPAGILEPGSSAQKDSWNSRGQESWHGD